jgi:CheY-like chemotaxis protein
MAGETNILIIDDTFDNFYLLKAFLSLYADCQVEWGKNGEEGLEKYYAEKPDIILLDLFMPVLNGFQVLEEIREKDKDTPIIVLSAFTCTENKLDALQKGCNDFLGKPIDTIHLEDTIRKYVTLQKR